MIVTKPASFGDVAMTTMRIAPTIAPTTRTLTATVLPTIQPLTSITPVRSTGSFMPAGGSGSTGSGSGMTAMTLNTAAAARATRQATLARQAMSLAASTPPSSSSTGMTAMTFSQPALQKIADDRAERQRKADAAALALFCATHPADAKCQTAPTSGGTGGTGGGYTDMTPEQWEAAQAPFTDSVPQGSSGGGYDPGYADDGGGYNPGYSGGGGGGGGGSSDYGYSPDPFFPDDAMGTEEASTEADIAVVEDEGLMAKAKTFVKEHPIQAAIAAFVAWKVLT